MTISRNDINAEDEIYSWNDLELKTAKAKNIFIEKLSVLNQAIKEKQHFATICLQQSEAENAVEDWNNLLNLSQLFVIVSIEDARECASLPLLAESSKRMDFLISQKQEMELLKSKKESPRARYCLSFMPIPPYIFGITRVEEKKLNHYAEINLEKSSPRKGRCCV